MFYVFLSVAILGMALLYIISVVPVLKTQIWLVFVAQFIKSTGVIIATGYMWALVPEVISYGEYTHGKRISGIVTFCRTGNTVARSRYSGGVAFGRYVHYF